MYATLCLFDRTEAVFAWSAIDDRVMGDVTHGAVRFDPADHAVFSGQVAPDNNAGFASVRALVSPVTAGEIDAIEPVVRGDGRRYKLNLRKHPANPSCRFAQAQATGCQRCGSNSPILL